MKLEKTTDTGRENLIDAAFHMMLDNTTDMVFLKDIDLLYIAASEPFVKMVGKQNVDEIVGKADTEIFGDQNLAKRYIMDDLKLLSAGKPLLDYIEPITEEHGNARYGSTSKYILSDASGEAIGILGITKDITRDYMAKQRYQQELKYLFELPPDMYAVSYIDIDSWRVISQRRQLIAEGTLQSCNTVEQLCDAALASIVDKKSEAAKFYVNFKPEQLKDIYASGRSGLSFQYQRQLSNGLMRWVHNEIKFLIDVETGHLCVMLSAKDIEMEIQRQQELVIAAKMDRMTMLFNRETTMEFIRKVLQEQSDRMHALFMLDVDNFKRLNDTLGHQCGDEFLVALAAKIKESFGESDIVGRIGGDEFFAFMTCVSGSPMVEKKAQDLLAAIQKVCFRYVDMHLSGSIGISIYPRHGKNVEELYRQADEALYQAKRSGKNQYVIAML